MTQQELVQKAQSGDETALNELYTAFYKRVYYLALRLTQDPQDAQDAAQETFLSALRALPNLQDPNAFEGWLFQITANKCRTLLHKNSHYTDLPEDEDGRTMLDDLPEADEALLPQEALESDENRRMILKIIDDLPHAQRECVMLFYYSQLSVQQIAETLDCSAGTVKSRLNYARQKIKESILTVERRDGIRLHVLAPLALLFVTDCDAMGVVAAPALATAAAAAAQGGGTAASAGTAHAAAGAAKTGLLAGVKAKVVAGVTAAALLTGGGAVLYQNQQPRPIDFADPAMEANLRLLLEIPEDHAITREDLEQVHQVGFIGGGMNLFYMGEWLGNGTTWEAPGTVPVSSFEDLVYFGYGDHLAVSIYHPTYPVDEETILEIVPYAEFIYHDGRDHNIP